jgi:hypothetical protein
MASKDQTITIPQKLEMIGRLAHANDKERLWLLKHWIVNHLCFKETEG